MGLFLFLKSLFDMYDAAKMLNELVSSRLEFLILESIIGGV